MKEEGAYPSDEDSPAETSESDDEDDGDDMFGFLWFPVLIMLLGVATETSLF